MKIGFTGLLALLFIGLKITGLITWAWVWVLLPLWLPFLLCVGMIGLCAAFAR